MAKQGSSYNYDTFSLSQIPAPETFAGPPVGEQALDFAATKVDGTPVRLSDYLGTVLVLESGSLTCPIYTDKVARMNDLQKRYPKVCFLVLYTHEAHPGELVGAHSSFADKVTNARVTRGTLGEHREILIDDIEGTAHAAYGGFPNMLYLIDAEGIVLMRGHWSDPATLEIALERHAERAPLAELRFRFRYPRLLQAMKTLLRAGWKAVWDGLRETPRFLLWHRRERKHGWG
jgi:hypothetical protein